MAHDSRIPSHLLRAIQARDKRFDGRFYTGVRTTGIYCRVVCPARPLLKNIVIFRSHAEAESSGYRPCLRCRPDLAPSSPLWQGTAAVVERALRMIGEGQCDRLALPRFAEKLGITDRHLRRLFDEHLGASPQEVAASKRLHHARLLLSQTTMPVTEVAFASGFRSIRRFNHAFAEKYQRSPREFRKAGSAEGTMRDALEVQLPVLQPFDWEYLYGFHRSHGIPGLEHFENGKYQRLLESKSGFGRLTVAYSLANSCLLVRIEGMEVGAIRGLLTKVRQMFDLDHNPAWLKRPLGGVRVPGAFSGFEAAVCVILGQMVSVEVAHAKAQRLVELFGREVKSPYPGLTRLFPAPKALAAASFTGLGITEVRKHAIRELARAVAGGELELNRSGPLAHTRERLASIRGIGPWTVELIAMRSLSDPDAFPAGDLIIKRATNLLRISETEWSPWRSYLTLWLWKNYAAKLSKKGKGK